MELNDYQTKALLTAHHPDIGHPIVYPTLGLVGEAGEFSNKLKKIFRDSNGVITEEMRSTLTKELGDVLWYVARLATALGVTLDEVGKLNLERLASRDERGTIHGSGDER